MKKKLLLFVVMIMALSCIFAITASAASAARVENYEDTYTLVNSTYIRHYERHYYNETQYHKKYYDDTITLTFIDEDGNPITEVPLWEYDTEDCKYYSLVWYISDWEFTKEDATTTISEVVYTYDKYTAATYTLKSIRA